MPTPPLELGRISPEMAKIGHFWPGNSGNDLVLTYMSTGLAGDFNGDGKVDGQDLLKWQRDGLSQQHLQDWENNYGMTSPLNPHFPLAPVHFGMRFAPSSC
jgi:hypothetical protein